MESKVNRPTADGADAQAAGSGQEAVALPGNMTRLAAALKVYFAVCRIDQKSFAKALGCSPSTITRFMNGQGTPEPRTMLRLFTWLLDTHQSNF